VQIDLDYAPHSALSLEPGEKIVHMSEDRFGKISVVDSELTRTLYFNSANKQSAMYKPHSKLLMLKYTHAMCLALVFLASNRRTLIMGLGGGALPKFLNWHYPETPIDVIDSRKKVIQIAHTYFDVPENDPNLRILHGDAGAFVVNSRNNRAGIYDLLLVDLFSATGPASILRDRAFYYSLPNLLSTNGIVGVNLWSQGRTYLQYRRLLEHAFPGRVLELSVGSSKSGNVILFGFNSSECTKNLYQYMDKAVLLQTKTGLKMVQYFNRLLTQNRPLWQRILLPGTVFPRLKS